MFRSIQWRVTIWFMLIVIVGMAALGGFLTVSVRNTQLDNLRGDLMSEAVIIAGVSLPYLVSSDNVDELDVFIKELGEETESRFTVVRQDGTVLADSHEDPTQMESHAMRPEIVEALTTGTGESTRYSTTIGERLMYVAVPISDGDSYLGVARVALPVTRVDSYISNAIRIIIMTTTIVAVVVIIAAWLITRVITRPIRELTAASHQLAAGDFTVHIPVGTDDESGQLALTFSEMATQLKNLVHALEDDKARLSAILENMADGIITTDDEGNVILANRAAGELLGFSYDNVTKRPLIEIVRDFELTDILNQCLATAQPEEVQFESSSSGRFLRAIAINITGDGAGGVLILLQDLTGLRALQTMRREIVGNISHDFRTPLSGIKAMVETLRDGAMNEPEVARNFLSRIEDEVDRLTHMVAELTELSRIETGRTELRRELVDLNAVVNESVIQMTPQAERQNLSWNTQLAADLPTISGDTDRLHQVLINLFHNAIKFNKPGGSITVVTKLADDSVSVSVSDTGIGISEENISRIFERFYKGDKSRSGLGSGMGLAIAKHIIEAHGGTISVTSAEGQGSTFTMRLPRTRNSV